MRRTIFAALAVVLATATATAQSATTPALTLVTVAAAADTGRVYRFDIPAQPLPDALADFARLTSLHIEISDTGADAAQSAPVSGSLTAPTALRTLLSGTGFAARFEDAE